MIGLYGQDWFFKTLAFWEKTKRDLFNIETINLSVGRMCGFIGAVRYCLTDDGVIYGHLPNTKLLQREKSNRY